MRRFSGILLLFLALCFVLACLPDTALAGDWQSFHIGSADGSNNPAMDYWVYVPDGETEGLPLVLFLHGSGERGTDALNQSLPLYIREGVIPPPDALLVVPQLPDRLRYWYMAENTLVRITDEAAAAFGADTASLSLAGFSLGGLGTWNLVKTAPGKFSRVLCVCGNISVWLRPALFEGTGLRICTGKKDSGVDAESERLYAYNARKAGIDAEWIEYPSGHLQTSVLVFTDTEMMKWLRLYTEKEEAP